MTTDIETRLTSAADSLDAAAAAYHSQIAGINATVAGSQAAYDALGANLKGVVSDVMYQSIFFKPDEAAANLVDGGHFRDYAELVSFISSTPNFCNIIVGLESRTLEINSNNSFGLGGRNIRFSESGSGTEKGKILLKTYEISASGFNRCYPLPFGVNSLTSIFGVDLEIDTPDDPSLGTVIGGNAAISTSAFASLQIQSCNVTAPSGFSLMMPINGGSVRFSGYVCAFDGPFDVIGKHSANLGSAIVGVSSATLLNGASLYSSLYTVGTNLLTT